MGNPIAYSQLTNYICVNDTKANTVDGGTFTSGAWRTRVLNTEVSDVGNHASLASNQITLEPGIYMARISAPAISVGKHQTRLRNITAGTTIASGTPEESNIVAYYAQTRSHIVTVFTITVSSALEVQHYCANTIATFGFGRAASYGESEIYTIAEFWKMA